MVKYVVYCVIECMTYKFAAYIVSTSTDPITVADGGATTTTVGTTTGTGISTTAAVLISIARTANIASTANNTSIANAGKLNHLYKCALCGHVQLLYHALIDVCMQLFQQLQAYIYHLLTVFNHSSKLCLPQ